MKIQKSLLAIITAVLLVVCGFEKGEASNAFPPSQKVSQFYGGAWAVFGDSNAATAYQGVSSLATSWTGVTSTQTGLPVYRYAVAGAQAIDQVASIYNAASVGDFFSNFTWALGTNDYRLYLGDANKQAAWKKMAMGSLEHLAVPSSAKYFASNAAWALTGSWTISGAITAGGTNVQKFASAGATASLTCPTGTTTIVYNSILSTPANGFPGTYTVSIDNVSQGTFSTEPTGPVAITGALGGVYGPSGYLFPGLSATASHTVKLTWVSGIVWNNWAACVGPWSINWPSVHVPGILKMTAAGYVTFGGSDAFGLAYQTDLLDVVTQLQAAGLHVNWSDVRASQNTATGLAADGIHLNDTGAAVFAATSADAVRASANHCR